MFKVIPQEEREKQIKELCEATPYSFVGWDGEYVGVRSIVNLNCHHHGLQKISVDKFIHAGQRCNECVNKRRWTSMEMEARLNDMFNSTRYTFEGWVGCYKGRKSKMVLGCAVHGEIVMDLNNILRGARCKSCYEDRRGKAKISPVYEKEDDIKRRLNNTIYSFQGWVNGYKGNKSDMVLYCQKHGAQTLKLDKFLHRGQRCNKCSGTYIFNQKEREIQIIDMVQKENLKFIRWSNGFQNNKSKLVISCHQHGEWIVELNSFLRGTRCPSCALTGYQPSRKGTLYCLRSECSAFVKVGITNNSMRRLTELRRKTPFAFDIIKLFTHEDGSIVQKWEKLFHESFESANLTGFDGCTEWLKWNPQIPLWFTFLT